jgi:hypothetical protein
MNTRRVNRSTELKAIDLMRKYYSKKYIVGNVSQKHIGMDLILIPKDNRKKVYSIEVKGMQKEEPQAVRLYESFKKFAKNNNYYLDIVCGVHSRYPKVYHIGNKHVLKWARISGQHKCYHILDIKNKLKATRIKPESLIKITKYKPNGR